MVCVRDAPADQLAGDSHENWWTGEDSNLRSPQGAADLQSAAISRSATCPHHATRRASRMIGRPDLRRPTQNRSPEFFAPNGRGIVEVALRGVLKTSS